MPKQTSKNYKNSIGIPHPQGPLSSSGSLCVPLGQWRTQKIFTGGFGSGSYGGHLYLVFAVCDVTIWRHFHVFKPTFWRSFL